MELRPEVTMEVRKIFQGEVGGKMPCKPAISNNKVGFVFFFFWYLSHGSSPLYSSFFSLFKSLLVFNPISAGVGGEFRDMDTFLQIISNVGLHGDKLKFCQSVKAVC